MDTLIKAEGLTKTYQLGDIATDAVNNLSFEIKQGEFVSIQGPSGCGKSTLLSMLGLMNPPSAGRLELFSQDVTTLNQKQRAKIRNKHIGFIFQSFNLVGELDVLDNVLLPAHYARAGDIQAKREKATAMLEELGLNGRLKHKPHQLSGGQQQRVAFVRSMIMEPDIILADEPTGNLDSKSADILMSLIGDANNQGAAVILVTHELSFADSAKRKIKLKDGCILSDE